MTGELFRTARALFKVQRGIERVAVLVAGVILANAGTTHGFLRLATVYTRMNNNSFDLKQTEAVHVVIKKVF